MNNLNSVLIEGNIVADPELQTTSEGKSICMFSVASDRFSKKGEEIEKETSFFDIVSYSRLAESCADLGKKGRGVRAVGRLKQDRWTDPFNGQAMSRIVIIAEHVEFRPEFKAKS